MDTSPLSQLPPELRNAIYEYVVVHDKPLHYVWNIVTHTFHPATPATPPSMSLLGLAGTCKKIRAECLPLFYASNTLQLGFNQLRVLGTSRQARESIRAAFTSLLGLLGYGITATRAQNTSGIITDDSPRNVRDVSPIILDLGTLKPNIYKTLPRTLSCFFLPTTTIPKDLPLAMRVRYTDYHGSEILKLEVDVEKDLYKEAERALEEMKAAINRTRELLDRWKMALAVKKLAKVLEEKRLGRLEQMGSV